MLWRKKAGQISRWTAQPDEERAEECVNGADLVKTHFVDQPFEYERVIGEERDPPLPIIEADRPGDDLLYLAGVTSSHETMLIHLPLALFNGKRVPVLVFSSATVHWIKADVPVRRHLRKQPRLHSFALSRKRVLDGSLPFVGVRFDPRVEQ